MLKLDLLPRTPDGELILKTCENGAMLIISEEVFLQRFEGAKTLDDYKNHPNATEGWRALFDEAVRRAGSAGVFQLTGGVNHASRGHTNPGFSFGGDRT